MKLVEAAEKALRAFGEPMHSREIISFAKGKGWIKPEGRTPEHSLQGAIWKNIHLLGNKSPFRMVGIAKTKRKYALRGSNHK